MISFLFSVFVMAIIWHYTYENGFLPVFRLHLKYKLFSERDQLRNLLFENKIDEKLFVEIQESANSGIHCMKFFDISGLLKAKEILKKNPDLNKQTTEKINRLLNSSNHEAVKIFKRIVAIKTEIFIVNSGGWIFYIFPFAVAIYLIKALKTEVLDRISSFITNIIILPENTIKNLMPEQCKCKCC